MPPLRFSNLDDEDILQSLSLEQLPPDLQNLLHRFHTHLHHLRDRHPAMIHKSFLYRLQELLALEVDHLSDVPPPTERTYEPLPVATAAACTFPLPDLRDE